MNAIAAIMGRDLRLAVRSGGGAGLGLAFFLITLLLLPLGIGPEQDRLSAVAPGLIWVAALLSCLLSIDRLFVVDHEDGTLDALVLSSIPVSGIVVAKACAHWLTTGLALTIVAPVLSLGFGLEASALPWLGLSLLIGTPALSFIGAIGGALTIGVRRGGLLLSLIVLPLYIPTLIFGARVVADAATGRDPVEPLVFLTAITLGSLALCPWVAASAIRINLR